MFKIDWMKLFISFVVALLICSAIGALGCLGYMYYTFLVSNSLLLTKIFTTSVLGLVMGFVLVMAFGDKMNQHLEKMVDNEN